MKSVIAYILLIAASTSVSLGQTLNYDSVESSYSIVESQHFIYLEVGNVWEYEVHHTENAGPVAPSFLRFTIETYRDTSPSIDDYFVRTDLYDDENKIQTALCLVRLQRGKVTIGSNVANFSVCNYQSPFSQQDFEIHETGRPITVGAEQVLVDAFGQYQHFWSDQNGDNGHISFLYASGVGLYRYQSSTHTSAFEADAKDMEWEGDLIYARVNGRELGDSEVFRRFSAYDLSPELTPVQ